MRPPAMPNQTPAWVVDELMAEAVVRPTLGARRYAEGMRHSSLALPDEQPADVVSLAQRFGARLMVLSSDGHGRWPSVIDAGPTGPGGPAAACFHEVPLTSSSELTSSDVLSGTRVFRIACP